MEGKKLGSLIVLPFWGKVKAKELLCISKS
jgi:hypothetical protein